MLLANIFIYDPVGNASPSATNKIIELLNLKTAQFPSSTDSNLQLNTSTGLKPKTFFSLAINPRNRLIFNECL